MQFNKRTVTAAFAVLAALMMIVVIIVAVPEGTSEGAVTADSDGGTFRNAFSDAESGDTVTLAGDLTLKDSVTTSGSTVSNAIWLTDGRTITVDLNGHTISKDQFTFFVTHGTLNITGTGTIQETKDNGYSPIILKGSSDSTASNYSVANIGKNVTLKGWTGIFIDNNGSASAYGVVVDFAGKVVTPSITGQAAGNGIYVNGSITGTTGNVPKITVRDTASVTCTGAGSTGIYAAGYANWIIEGGVISGETGIEIRAGTMTITGGTITGNASEFKVTSNGNGSTNTGAGIVVAQHTTALPISVDVSGDVAVSGIVALCEVNPENNDPLTGVSLAISGGSFSTREGTNSTDISGAIYSKDCKAFITDGSFSDLSALNYTASVAEIELNADYTSTGTVTVKDGTILDIAKGKTLTINGTVIDNGIIDVYGTVKMASATSKLTVNDNVKVFDGGKLVNYTFQEIVCGNDDADIVFNYGSSLTNWGGAISGHDAEKVIGNTSDYRMCMSSGSTILMNIASTGWTNTTTIMGGTVTVGSDVEIDGHDGMYGIAIGSGSTAIVGSTGTLVIDKGKTLYVEGARTEAPLLGIASLEIYGTLVNNGTLVNDGKITIGKASVISEVVGKLTNNGTVSGKGTITLVDKGAAMNNGKDSTLTQTVIVGSDEAVFSNVKAGTTGIAITYGSLIISGDYDTAADGTITINGTATVSGTLESGTKLIVSTGSTLKVGDEFVVKAGSELVKTGANVVGASDTSILVIEKNAKVDGTNVAEKQTKKIDTHGNETIEYVITLVGATGISLYANVFYVEQGDSLAFLDTCYDMQKGYKLIGWFDGDVIINSSFIPTADMTLDANVQEKVIPSTSSSGQQNYSDVYYIAVVLVLVVAMLALAAVIMKNKK